MARKPDRALNLLLLLVVSLAVTADLVAGLSQPMPVTTRRGNNHHSKGGHEVVAGRASISSSTALRGGATNNGDDSDEQLKSYAGEASSLFGNLRVPAALFSGASAGAAFAMPIAAGGSEGLKIGLVKRLYALLMITSLSSQIIVVVVATLAMGNLSLVKATKTKDVGDLLDMDYNLEWTAARFSFLVGLGCFSIASGLRAWVVIACPIFSKASLGMILSATLLCVAFVRDTFRYGNDAFLTKIPFKFVKLLFERAKKDGIFALALVAYLITWTYMIVSVPHVLKWLKLN